MWAADTLAANTLSWNQTLIVVGAVAATVLLAGLIVIYGRSTAPPTERGGSVVRSWIAIALVIGLVLFSAFAFAVDDASMRSTLIGGLTASVGAAIAFYFSSRSSDQAREDILDAAFGTDTVPQLNGLSKEKATAALGQTSLKLEVDPAGSTDPQAVVESQTPAPNSQVRKGSSVVVTLKNP